jgi:hypothetical protein
LRDHTIYFQHIAESIDLIRQYLADADGAPSRELFYEDHDAQHRLDSAGAVDQTGARNPWPKAALPAARRWRWS